MVFMQHPMMDPLPPPRDDGGKHLHFHHHFYFHLSSEDGDTEDEKERGEVQAEDRGGESHPDTQGSYEEDTEDGGIHFYIHLDPLVLTHEPQQQQPPAPGQVYGRPFVPPPLPHPSSSFPWPRSPDEFGFDLGQYLAYMHGATMPPQPQSQQQGYPPLPPYYQSPPQQQSPAPGVDFIRYSTLRVVPVEESGKSLLGFCMEPRDPNSPNPRPIATFTESGAAQIMMLIQKWMASQHIVADDSPPPSPSSPSGE